MLWFIRCFLSQTLLMLFLGVQPRFPAGLIVFMIKPPYLDQGEDGLQGSLPLSAHVAWSVGVVRNVQQGESRQLVDRYLCGP